MSTVLNPPAPSRHALPDPGETVPSFSWPIAGIFASALALFATGTWLALEGRLPGVTIALNAIAIFVMFTVVHDASHYSISSRRWVNGVFGRVAMLFVSPLIAFPAFGFIHIEHHRHTNDDDHDPDHFASHGPWWQLPFRFAAMDVPYVGFYVRNLRRRPRAEVLESAALLLTFTGVVVVTIATGHLLAARDRLSDPGADRDDVPGVVVRLAAPPRTRGDAEREPLPRDPQPGRAWSGCSRH